MTPQQPTDDARGPITAIVAAELADELIKAAKADRRMFMCPDTVDEVADWLRGRARSNPTQGVGESKSPA
ncbi:hypothetical protein PV569_12990 [Streptomyces scabiei]|uniref:hypothetical protein n=1 Tax=Streptomyces scabiei TaxID=1930 RepID=UPI0029B063DF|nr:hypothetical protein [Streptomyces scabiei]MDX3294622.1 hypothetical protein [Streptomyces scabiei]